MYPDHLSETEAKIINAIIKSALELGYSISVCDGEEWPLLQCPDEDLIKQEIGNTEETILVFYECEEQIGSALLIHGEEEQVIGDYTDNLATEVVLQAAKEIAETLELVEMTNHSL